MRCDRPPISVSTDKDVREPERYIVSLACILSTSLGTTRDHGKIAKSSNQDVVDFSLP